MIELGSSAGQQDVSSQTGHAYRDALRLLFILVRGSASITPASDGWDRAFYGEKRALAIDFWIRYPDYLADQLLSLYARTQDTALLDAARHIFDSDEPDVRIVKMIRWRRGAYDDLQQSLSILGYRGLAKSMKRKLANGKYQYEYLTGPLAREFLQQALSDQPALSWYETQTNLALLVAQDKSGTALKDIHYADDDYASTPYGAVIPSIKSRVLQRMSGILEKQSV
ncbi:hypothetical protein AAH995_05285 [Pseudomonas putida]|jgi:hypothetical protein|uniref:hypothetical protein n=1 Tax=Pseudomonas putida group TaxID=136845 RepID=UPI001E4ABB31|nr:hypothetical protein [Pseudomonas alloputida]MCE0861821.1 hypothetical protein [Pseudomonas alloputida]MCE0871639.1 hypothetical protein [Pseudomonas alloputida]MCE0891251.1 hypothetical protein [Pseudomonas alloputida]MCE0920372.1 hypothetical protein [Pseudomonas alloputida]MCE1046834.1 hypothetical protein [Pseudomonas alloputida]